jgi:outer membrane protein OmpA-like peptidoglycan-associated protein
LYQVHSEHKKVLLIIDEAQQLSNHFLEEIRLLSNIELDYIAEILEANQEARIRVTGYTDNSGSLDYNLNISDLRANIVKTYLINKGIDNSRIEAIGLGPKDPVTGNETTEGRRLNRRVEIEFYTDKTHNSYSNVSRPP